VAQAFGEPEGILVSMNSCTATLVGTPRPQAEIAEARFFTSEEYRKMLSKAPAVEALLTDLMRQNAID